MAEKKHKLNSELEGLNLDDLLALLRKEETQRLRRSSPNSQDTSSDRDVIQRLIDRVQQV